VNTNIYNSVFDEVRTLGLDIVDFQDVVTYLLENGVICREDKKIEEGYYDKFVRMESVVKDYLNLINISVEHDEDLYSVRLYAPSSDTPKEKSDGEVKSALSMRFSNEESAYLLALTILYNQKLNEGHVLDDASVEVNLEEFNTILATSIGYTPHENKTNREESLRTLHKLKAVKFAKGVFEDEDRPLIIRPYIKQIILPEMLKPFLETDKVDKGDSDEN